MSMSFLVNFNTITCIIIKIKSKNKDFFMSAEFCPNQYPDEKLQLFRENEYTHNICNKKKVRKYDPHLN